MSMCPCAVLYQKQTDECVKKLPYTPAKKIQIPQGPKPGTFLIIKRLQLSDFKGTRCFGVKGRWYAAQRVASLLQGKKASE